MPKAMNQHGVNDLWVSKNSYVPAEDGHAEQTPKATLPPPPSPIRFCGFFSCSSSAWPCRRVSAVVQTTRVLGTHSVSSPADRKMY